MSTLLITEPRHGGRLVSQPTRLHERLLARLHAWRLDEALAAGACPDESPVLSLRAARLIGKEIRRDLSRAIRDVLRAAERPQHPLDGGVHICVREVRSSRPTLEELADRLAGWGPVESGGVARVRLLLRDGGGPLYNDVAADHLERALRAAIDALEPQL